MRHLNLSKKMIILVIAGFIIMLFNAGSDLVYEYHKDQKSLEVLEANLREDYDKSIQMQMETLFAVMDTLRLQYQKENLSQEEIKIKIADTIRDIRYGENGYFWADTITGKNIVLYGSEVEGTNRYELQDSNGKYIIKEIIKNGLSGGGYTDYLYPKEGDENPQPKRAYSKYYDPFGWVVGTGIYTNDIDAEILDKKEMLEEQLQYKMFVHISIIAGFFTFVIFVIWTFSKKMADLITFSSSYAQAISKGDFEIKIPEKFIKRRDELGILLKSLAEMKSSLINTFQDIEYTNDQLSAEKDFLDTVLETISDGIVVVNGTGKIQLVNSSTTKILGKQEEEIVESLFEDVFAFSDKDNHIIPAMELLQLCRKNGSETKRECFLLNHKPKLYIEDSAAPILDENGKLNSFVYVFRDISEKEKKQKEIEYLSYHDLLTGVFNRRFFDLISKELIEKEAFPIGIIVADLNALKLTNDAFGHIMGDKLIRTFASTLKNGAKEGDFVFRIGGDEFVILLPQQNEYDAQKFISDIKHLLSQTFVGSIPLSAAFGCCVCEDKGDLLEEAFRQADEAMYHNKLKENESFKIAMIDSILESNRYMFWNEKKEIQQVILASNQIGEELHFNPLELNRLIKASAIYNIGYSTLDRSIINKEDELNSRDWDEIRKHPMAGYHMLKNLSVYSDIAEIILEHHENLDGTGYPRGLEENQIHSESLVLSVTSAYYSMINVRPYRAAMTPEAALEEIKKGAGTKYDAKIVKILENLIKNSGLQ